MSDRDTALAQRRRDILEAARDAFDASGYAATTIDQVAAMAGISKGSVYNYFHSKRDLFESVFLESLAEDEIEWDRLVLEPGPAREKLARLLDYCFTRMEGYRNVGKLVLEFWATAARQSEDGSVAGGLHETFDRYAERLSRVIREGMASGEFRRGLDVRSSARLIMATLDGIITQAIIMGMPMSSELLATYKDNVLRSLAADQADQVNRAEIIPEVEI
jgi:AcrR family transcriptional regulator